MEQMPVSKTVVWKQAENLSLYADVFVPPHIKPGEKRLVAMLFHGGGHVMFSRQQVNPKQVALLLSHGYLPVSFDYRLCPELNVLDGPMNNVCEALRWSRFQLPSVAPTLEPGLEVDAEKVAAVGWPSGGHLSMTLGFTAPQRRLRPPEAILAYYCPTDYESEHRKLPPSRAPRLNDAGGSPLPLHTAHDLARANVAFLLRGPSYDPSDTTFPATAEVQSISPYAHILSGAFRTPTFLLHGKIDDLLPWQQSMRTIEALKENGVEADIEVVDGAVHLFDSFPQPGVDFEAKEAKGYAWLRKVVFGS